VISHVIVERLLIKKMTELGIRNYIHLYYYWRVLYWSVKPIVCVSSSLYLAYVRTVCTLCVFACLPLSARDAPPVANAGGDHEIQLPVDNVQLDGRRSTDDVAVVSYTWKVVEGDQDSLYLTGDEANVLSVGGLKAGNYTFRLTVADGKGQTDDDTARVFVKGALVVRLVGLFRFALDQTAALLLQFCLSYVLFTFAC